MTTAQMRTRQVQLCIPIMIVLAHLGALIVCIAYLYLAWDGGQVIRQAMASKTVSVYSPEVYRAVDEHYFSNVAEAGWAPLSLLIGISNVIQLYVLAPASLMLTTFLLPRQSGSRWRWFVVGLSLLVIVLLWWQAPSLRYLAVILD